MSYASALTESISSFRRLVPKGKGSTLTPSEEAWAVEIDNALIDMGWILDLGSRKPTVTIRPDRGEIKIDANLSQRYLSLADPDIPIQQDIDKVCDGLKALKGVDKVEWESHEEQDNRIFITLSFKKGLVPVEEGLKESWGRSILGRVLMLTDDGIKEVDRMAKDDEFETNRAKLKALLKDMVGTRQKIDALSKEM